MRTITTLFTVFVILASAAVGIAGDAGGYDCELIKLPPECKKADSSMADNALLYSPKKKQSGKIPLVVLLHGAGGCKKNGAGGFKGNKDVKWFFQDKYSKYVARVMVPQSKSHWNGDALNAAVDHLLKKHKDLDKDRIYCLGYSLGGLGTWNWGKHSPDRVAAIVPVAFKANFDDEQAKKMLKLPIWAMCGTKDRRRAGTIGPMEAKFKELGSKVVKKTMFEGAGHGCSGMAWNQEGMMEWLFSQSLTKR